MNFGFGARSASLPCVRGGGPPFGGSEGLLYGAIPQSFARSSQMPAPCTQGSLSCGANKKVPEAANRPQGRIYIRGTTLITPPKGSHFRLQQVLSRNGGSRVSLLARGVHKTNSGIRLSISSAPAHTNRRLSGAIAKWQIFRQRLFHIMKSFKHKVLHLSMVFHLK